MIPLLGFMPDADPTRPGVITLCDSLVPTPDGFKAAPTLQNIGYSALAADPRGAADLVLTTGTPRTYAGTTAGLYELVASAWTDRSRGGGYALNSGNVDHIWSFCQFGDTSVAASLANVLQRSTGGAFADIASSPQALVVESASGFVLAFNTSVTADTWKCSAYLDETDWAVSVATQCTTGRLISTPGPIVAAKRFGNEVIAYKKNSMYVGRYVGAPVVWQWDVISTSVGCLGPNAVTETPRGHYFIGNDGLYLFDGTTPRLLSEGVNSDWMRTNVSGSGDAGLMSLLATAVWDKTSRLIWIYYPTSSGSRSLDGNLVYDPERNQWGRATPSYDVASRHVSVAFQHYASVAEPQARIGVFSTADQKIYSLTGTPAGLVMRTHHIGDVAAETVCNNLRVQYLKRPATSSVDGFTSGYPDESEASWTAGASGASLNEDRYNVRQRARWHRFVITTTSDAELTGLRPELLLGGRR